MPAERAGLGVGGRLVMHGDQLDAVLLLHRENGEMVVRARAKRRDADRASGAFFAASTTSFTRLERRIRFHRPDIVVEHVVHQRREAVERLLAIILPVEIAGIHRRHVEIADGVAVRLRLRERAPADPAAAARSVLHRYRLAEHGLEILRQHARGDVGAAARAIRHDQRDIAFGILRGGRQRAGRECERQHGAERDGHVAALASSKRPPVIAALFAVVREDCACGAGSASGSNTDGSIRNRACPAPQRCRPWRRHRRRRRPAHPTPRPHRR